MWGCVCSGGGGCDVLYKIFVKVGNLGKGALCHVLYVLEIAVNSGKCHSLCFADQTGHLQ